MTQNVIQTSFASGELSPTLFARVDVAKFKSGAATMRNFFVDYRSGASTRPGTKYVITALIPSKPVRLIPFQTSILVPYILEFGDFYVRPISQGSSVLEPSFNITAASQAVPLTLSAPGNNFNVGDWVFISGVGGMTNLNNRFYRVALATGGNLQLADVNTGNPVNSINYPAFTGGGTVARVYGFASPYAAEDLALLKFVQVANVMYLVHPSYPPQTLTFLGPTSWVFAPIVFGTTVPAPGTPTAVASDPTTTPQWTFGYIVTSVDASGQESGPSPPFNVSSVDIGASQGSILVSWASTGADSYNVYKAEPGIATQVPTLPVGASYGFIGNVDGSSTSLVDGNIVPDFTQGPPIANNPFDSGNNPGAVCFFQQRLYYGGSNADPQTFWASQPGFYNNFDISNPTQEDDSIEGTLVSFQVNYIRSMVPMPGGLIILTAKGAWQLSGGGAGLATTAVTPTNAISTPQAYNGISNVPPIIVNQDVLYVQAKGSIVRDLQYNIYANIYSGTDISIMSNHLFFGYTIKEWAYAEEPFKLVWAVRSDGDLLSLTYVKEQEIIGWARHDTLGRFMSTATVTEASVDAVYFVVQRQLQGIWTQTIERLADREFTYGAEDAWCVDCGSRSTPFVPAATLFLSGPIGTVTAISDTPNTFNSGNPGSLVIRVGGGILNCVGFVNTQEVVCEVVQPVTQVLGDGTVPPLPFEMWGLFSTFTGLDYLEGQLVQILADGAVITPQVVTNGEITLPQPASKVVVGLKFTPQLQTMYLDIGQETDTIQGKRKKISALTVRVNETRGLSFGQTFANLSPIKELMQGMTLGEPIPLISFDERVIMDPLWDGRGQICLEQDNPLPATVLGVIPEITVGDTGK